MRVGLGQHVGEIVDVLGGVAHHAACSGAFGGGRGHGFVGEGGFIDLDAERHAGRVGLIGRVLDILELAQDLVLDLALLGADVFVCVLAHRVVEEVFDARTQRGAESLHLGRDLDAVDVELEGDASLDQELAVFDGARDEGARGAGVDAQRDFAGALLDQRLLVILGAARITRHEGHVGGVAVLEDLDGRIPEGNGRAQGAVIFSVLRGDERGVRAGVVAAHGAVDQEYKEPQQQQGDHNGNYLKHGRRPLVHHPRRQLTA